MTRFATISSAALAGLLAALPVQAQDTRATFQYDPADLATPDGAAAAYERLRLVTKRACEVPSPILKRQEFDCRRDIESALVTKVGSPILFAIHRDAQHRVRVATAD